MTQAKHGVVTLKELFEMALKKEANICRLSRRSGISRATLLRVKRKTKVWDVSQPPIRIEFATYGKLARFVLEGE